MQIHDLNAKSLTNPAYVAFDDGTDTYKADFKDIIDTAAAEAVADADLTDNTVAFTSGDAASPTEWTAVDVLTSGLPIKTLFSRISTMIKNVRWLNSKFGGVAFKQIQKTVTLPAGTPSSPSVTNIDLTNDIAGSIISADVFLGDLHLPYATASGLVGTWVYSANGKVLRIANATSAWQNYTAYLVVGYVAN